MGDRGEHAELRGAERRAGGERDVAPPDVLALVADVLAGVPAVAHRDPVAREGLGVLLADHRVGARGERRAREDPDRLARTHCLRGKAARGDGFDHVEGDGAVGGGGADVRCPGGVAVHRRIVPARQIDRADHVLGEHEVEHFFEGPALGGERRDVLEDGPRRFGRSQHLTAPESWRGPTPGSPASPATTCPRSGTRETRPGIAGGP